MFRRFSSFVRSAFACVLAALILLTGTAPLYGTTVKAASVTSTVPDDEAFTFEMSGEENDEASSGSYRLTGEMSSDRYWLRTNALFDNDIVYYYNSESNIISRFDIADNNSHLFDIYVDKGDISSCTIIDIEGWVASSENTDEVDYLMERFFRSWNKVPESTPDTGEITGIAYTPDSDIIRLEPYVSKIKLSDELSARIAKISLCEEEYAIFCILTKWLVFNQIIFINNPVPSYEWKNLSDQKCTEYFAYWYDFASEEELEEITNILTIKISTDNKYVSYEFPSSEETLQFVLKIGDSEYEAYTNNEGSFTEIFGIPLPPVSAPIGHTDENKDGVCDRCGDVFSGCSHASTEIINVKEATCTESGYTGDTVCKDCKAVITEGSMIDQLGHSYTGEVKCNNDGTHSYRCVNGCGQFKTKENCDFTATVIVEPTICAKGKEKLFCAKCGYETTRETDMLPSETAVNSESGISVSYQDKTFENKDVSVIVNETYDGTEFFATKLNKSYNISIVADGKEVQPNVPVVVRIPLPNGFNAKSVSVIHINSATGEQEPVTIISRDNGYITFIAKSFSVYILVDESSDTAQPSVPCNHLCHKTGFLGFIWKIVNLFNKFFKTNQYCECGAKHW